jgi:alkanesulfonate monooxygenase SsuD/methylene tetrahydromethanopterin reductase-like flavin-dependent oxidoreductase (luciferase family)
MHARHVTFGIKSIPSDYRNVRDAWREADAIPLIESAWLWDHMIPIREPRSGPMLEGWTLLAALAAQTSRLRLGLMVTGNTNRPPAILAKIAATVDVISGGRLEFGIGAGGGQHPLAIVEYEMYGVPSFPMPEAIARLDEACGLIRRLWTEPVVDHDGPHYRARGTFCEPKPIQKPHPPFVIAGSGERMSLRVVARHANTWNFPVMDPAGELKTFRHKSQVLDEHCAAVGRDPREIGRQVYMVTSLHDPPATREALQTFAAAGATQLIIGLRDPYAPGLMQRLAEELIAPVAEQLS